MHLLGKGRKPSAVWVQKGAAAISWEKKQRQQFGEEARNLDEGRRRATTALGRGSSSRGRWRREAADSTWREREGDSAAGCRDLAQQREDEGSSRKLQKTQEKRGGY